MVKACRGMVNLVKTAAPIGRPSTLKNHHLIMATDFKVILTRKVPNTSLVYGKNNQREPQEQNFGD